MKAAYIALFALVFTLASAYNTEDGVVILNRGNFDQAISEFDYALVEFYAPWCGHCKRLAPEYSQAAEELASSHPEVKLCKVDAHEETSLAEKYEINGFPTLKFFIKGNSQPIEYNGGRTTNDILNWVRRKVGQVTVEVTSVEEAEKLLSSNEAVVFFFGTPSSNAYKNFASVASLFDEVIFVYSNNAAVLQKYGGNENTIVVFADYGEEKNVYNGDDSDNSLKNFISTHRFPIVMPFNQHSAQRIFAEGVSTIFLIRGNDANGAKAEEAFRTIANTFHSNIAFCLATIEEDLGGRLAEYLGIGEDDVPAIRIVDPTNNNKKYLLEKEVSTDNLRTFINDFLGNNLKPTFKSEAVPSSPFDGNVRVVVGKNFNEVVLDTSKDVLIELYAPWCGHCQELAPVYDALAAKFRDSNDVVIAKMDASANEVDGVEIQGFPTIRFYPKNNKQAPIEYEGDRSEASFVEFLKKNQNQTPSAGSSSSSQEQTRQEEKPKIKSDEL